MQSEIYVDISGYESKYQVSNLGNVRSLNYHREQKIKILQHEKVKGYLRVALCKNSIIKRFQVHRLVALAFLPNPNNYTDVHHKNGNRTENSAKNLHWINRAEHKQEHSKLNADDIVEIFRLYNVEKWLQKRIADKYVISQQHVSNILLRKDWSNVPIPAEYL